MSRAQEIVFNCHLHLRIIHLYSSLIIIFREYQESNRLESDTLKSKMLGIMKTCLDTLQILIKKNPRFKNELIKHLHEFLTFSQFNVGQSDLISELFVENPNADLQARSNMIAYFTQKIVSEGNQVRFLRFFDSYIESRKDESNSGSLTLILDTFLPYNLPKDLTDNLKLIYGSINQETMEHEMYLADDFEAFADEQNNELIVFKSEPFLYHKALLEIFLKLLHTGISNIVKIRLRKYFSINYMFRFLNSEDRFFDGATSSLTTSTIQDFALLSKPDRQALGHTLLKPLMSEIFYRIYSKDEKSVFRSVLPSLNILTSLMIKETDRMKQHLEKYDPIYARYISFIFKSMLKLFHSKFGSRYGSAEYEVEVFCGFARQLLEHNSILLEGQITDNHVKSLKDLAKFVDAAPFDQALELILDGVKKNLPTDGDAVVVEGFLERKISQIRIERIGPEEIWEIGLDELKKLQQQVVYG